MIRSIPNPPMDRDDIARFRANMEKHLRGKLNEEERRQADARRVKAETNARKIIQNCGGKNPILGY